MDRTRSLSRIFLALVVLLLVACGKAKEEAAAARNPGAGAGRQPDGAARRDPAEAWPTLLATKTGWLVTNAGVSGDTSAGALQRLPALLDEHSPQLVLVTLGGNDMLRRLPQAQTTANLGQMLLLVKARGAKAVLLATPKPTIAGAAFNNLSPAEFYRQVAKDNQVPLIEDAMADVLSDPQLKGDQLHPNAAGHALLSKKVFEALKKTGFAR
jgi:acyl-CoA thioesterase-1